MDNSFDLMWQLLTGQGRLICRMRGGGEGEGRGGQRKDRARAREGWEGVSAACCRSAFIRKPETCSFKALAVCPVPERSPHQMYNEPIRMPAVIVHGRRDPGALYTKQLATKFVEPTEVSHSGGDVPRCLPWE